LDESQIEKKIATAPSPKFLGLFRGVVYDYEIFDRLVLQRDLARVERVYRAEGFYEAHARAGRVLKTDDGHVRVEIVVEEGRPVLVRSLRIDGLEGLPDAVIDAARTAAQDALIRGERFEEEKFVQAENDLRRVLTDRGYAYATVQREATVDLVRHAADVWLDVTPGRTAVFGRATITGLGKLPEDKVRQTLDIAEGDPYSTETIQAATQALLDLGVFSSVEIIPDLRSPNSGVVPLTVKVEPTRLHTVTLGGGVEMDTIKTDLHLIAGYEHKNFFGGLRTFSVNFKPGVVLYPMRIDNMTAPSKLLFEERLRLELRQPGFIEARTNAFIRPEFNIYPVLLRTDPEPDDPVLGYREFKGTTGVDRTLWKLYGNLNYNFQLENPFTYAGTLDPALRTLILSYPELVTQADFRDDKISPHKGIWLGNSLQVAGGPFGGHAQDVKVQPEVRGYVPVLERLTWASRATVGLLFPFNYGDVVQNKLSDPFTTEAERAERTRDMQIVFFRGFFSGGPNSNRGYAPRTIAPHAVVPFLTPETEALKISQACDPDDADYDEKRCSIPVGGFTLWEASTELRIGLTELLSTAVFCDASDVSNQTVDIRLGYLHLSCGAGLRYGTPLGPLRLDVGYRIPGLQYPSDADERVEGDPGDFFGLPLAIAFGIGEAF
jgi:outer membrane protein insertion porin family/translocation and assembly module TamA